MAPKFSIILCPEEPELEYILNYDEHTWDFPLQSEYLGNITRFQQGLYKQLRAQNWTDDQRYFFTSPIWMWTGDSGTNFCNTKVRLRNRFSNGMRRVRGLIFLLRGKWNIKQTQQPDTTDERKRSSHRPIASGDDAEEARRNASIRYRKLVVLPFCWTETLSHEYNYIHLLC